MSKNQSSDQQHNGHAYYGFENHSQTPQENFFDEGDESFALSDEIDHEILMHRDVHFGGDFDVMLDYYQNEEHIGINPEFDFERISYLAEVEKEMGHDLAPLFLTGAEAEGVSRARAAYAELKELYSTEEEKNPNPRLIADLILSEFEEPQAEIEAVVSQRSSIVPDLIALLKSDDFYNPLFPGYGYAPFLATLCLGQIGDERGIIPIFEILSKQIIFDEMAVVEALVNIGEKAKEFLLKVLKGRPLTQDNPNAAFALISFEDPNVAIACFEELQKEEVQEKPLLVTYLICSCQFLNTPFHRDAFKKMANDTHISSSLRDEMKPIIEEWKD